MDCLDASQRLKKWLHQKLDRHEYYVVQDFTPWSRRLACTKCEDTWAMHDKENVVLPWDNGFEELYAKLGFKVINPWKNSS